ncbi:MAG: (Fe-S)-binding protein [Pseudomonadota bacterium]
MTHASPPHAPRTPDLLALADRCVQCGLCLPSCPTYRLEGLETESPRGRIALVRAWEQGTRAPTATGEAHLDACLGCRRCEAVCPADVRFDALLTAARTRQRARRRPGTRQRAIEWVTARPRVLEALLRGYRIVWPLLPPAARPLPRPPAPATAARPAEPTPTDGRAALFLGCVARGYETSLHAAIHRLGAACGVAIDVPRGQTCCGSLHAHAGDASRADALAAANRAAFAGSQPVLTLASGCHDTVGAALGARTRDAIEFFALRADRLRFAPCPERVALHLPCTQRNVVRSDDALRRLLARVPALEVVELDAGFGCCGAAGAAMLTAPERAARFRQPLIDAIAASGASRLLSANIGCRLHLAGGAGVPVLHPLEFLAECLP